MVVLVLSRQGYKYRGWNAIYYKTIEKAVAEANRDKYYAQRR